MTWPTYILSEYADGSRVIILMDKSNAVLITQYEHMTNPESYPVITTSFNKLRMNIHICKYMSRTLMPPTNDFRLEIGCTERISIKTITIESFIPSIIIKLFF